MLDQPTNPSNFTAFFSITGCPVGSQDVFSLVSEPDVWWVNFSAIESIQNEEISPGFRIL